MPINVHYQNTPLIVVPTASFTINIDLKHVTVILITLLVLAITGLMFYLFISAFLQHRHNNAPPNLNPTPTATNFTVAQDGSGDYTTISAAVHAAPTHRKHMFLIKIRPGLYQENVVVGPSKTINGFVGDGVNKTMLTSDKFAGNERAISFTATIWAREDGFTAKDITFKNAAKPDQGPAAAASIQSDHSTFYRCRFLGHQATLHARFKTQFYKDRELHGPVDIIRGAASAVFKNCKIYARLPSSAGQNITITARERDSLRLRSGFSLQNCSVMAAADLLRARLTAATAYLDRPLGNYSTVLVMQSILGNLIDPAGWLDWDDRSALSALYFGEYANTGPGANRPGRVKWPDYRVLISIDATNFTADNFIGGEDWLPSTGVPFAPGLS